MFLALAPGPRGDMTHTVSPQFVVLACDESGSKGYADRDEEHAGEVGVFVGVMIPGELLVSAQARFDAIAKKYETRPGKVHIADLTPEQQTQLRKEIYALIEALQLPCFFEAIHVAGFHANFQSLKAMRERAKERRRSHVKVSENGSRPESLHEALFFGLYSKLLAFCMERDRKLLHIEVRTDQVDAPIFKNFQAAAKSLLEYGAKIREVSGFDPIANKVVRAKIETSPIPHESQLPITITQLDFKRITTLDGLVLAADVIANSLAYHYRTRKWKDRYKRLNWPEAIESHPLFKSLDAFQNWGTLDLSDALYAHPCDPDIVKQKSLSTRLWTHIRCSLRWVRLHFRGCSRNIRLVFRNPFRT